MNHVFLCSKKKVGCCQILFHGDLYMCFSCVSELLPYTVLESSFFYMHRSNHWLTVVCSASIVIILTYSPEIVIRQFYKTTNYIHSQYNLKCEMEEVLQYQSKVGTDFPIHLNEKVCPNV